MMLQILWSYLRVLNIFTVSSEFVNNATSFRIILNKVTKLVDLLGCPKYFSDYSQVLENSTSFKIILNIVTKLEDLPYML